jgi:hypothetical protein
MIIMMMTSTMVRLIISTTLINIYMGTVSTRIIPVVIATNTAAIILNRYCTSRPFSMVFLIL